MTLVQIIVLLLVIGVVLWLINTYLPMDPMIKRIISGLLILVVVIWLLSAVGLLPGGKVIG